MSKMRYWRRQRLIPTNSAAARTQSFQARRCELNRRTPRGDPAQRYLQPGHRHLRPAGTLLAADKSTDVTMKSTTTHEAGALVDRHAHETPRMAGYRSEPSGGYMTILDAMCEGGNWLTKPKLLAATTPTMTQMTGCRPPPRAGGAEYAGGGGSTGYSGTPTLASPACGGDAASPCRRSGRNGERAVGWHVRSPNIGAPCAAGDSP